MPRKVKPKSKMVGVYPADRAIIMKCQMIVAAGRGNWAFPEDEVIELAEFILTHVKLPKLSGPEIAAMVDEVAIQSGSISKAAQGVALKLYNTVSVEAILQAHKRYGRTSKSIRDEAAIRKAEDDDDMSEDDRRELESMVTEYRGKVERLERTWNEYLAAKKDIYG